MNAAKENTLKCELYHDNYQNYRRYNIWEEEFCQWVIVIILITSVDAWDMM